MHGTMKDWQSRLKRIISRHWVWEEVKKYINTWLGSEVRCFRWRIQLRTMLINVCLSTRKILKWWWSNITVLRTIRKKQRYWWDRWKTSMVIHVKCWCARPQGSKIAPRRKSCMIRSSKSSLVLLKPTLGRPKLLLIKNLLKHFYWSKKQNKLIRNRVLHLSVWLGFNCYKEMPKNRGKSLKKILSWTLTASKTWKISLTFSTIYKMNRLHSNRKQNWWNRK